jgi:hypothetical protein
MYNRARRESETMNIRAGLFLGLSIVSAGPALPAAGPDCAATLARIRATLTIAKLRPADAARVEALVGRGETLLNQGNRTDCQTPLREAAALLGI